MQVVNIRIVSLTAFHQQLLVKGLNISTLQGFNLYHITVIIVRWVILSTYQGHSSSCAGFSLESCSWHFKKQHSFFVYFLTPYVSTSHITSTPSAFKVILQLMMYISYLSCTCVVIIYIVTPCITTATSSCLWNQVSFSGVMIGWTMFAESDLLELFETGFLALNQQHQSTEGWTGGTMIRTKWN